MCKKADNKVMSSTKEDKRKYRVALATKAHNISDKGNQAVVYNILNSYVAITKASPSRINMALYRVQIRKKSKDRRSISRRYLIGPIQPVMQYFQEKTGKCYA